MHNLVLDPWQTYLYIISVVPVSDILVPNVNFVSYHNYYHCLVRNTLRTKKRSINTLTKCQSYSADYNAQVCLLTLSVLLVRFG